MDALVQDKFAELAVICVAVNKVGAEQAAEIVTVTGADQKLDSAGEQIALT